MPRGRVLRPMLAGALGASLLLAADPAQAEPVVTETIKPYRVTGDTAKDIRADINRKRKAAAGGVYDAVNRWHLNWRYDNARTEKGCALSNVRITVDVTIVIPELGPEAPGGVRPKFDAYIVKLLAHERGHSQTGIDAARQIEGELEKLPAGATCKEINAEADRLARLVIQKSKQRDKDYDQRTRHGATQGATYP